MMNLMTIKLILVFVIIIPHSNSFYIPTSSPIFGRKINGNTIFQSSNHKPNIVIQSTISEHNEHDLDVDVDVDVEQPSSTEPILAKRWFPVKPEDALLTRYDTLVRGAYIRHVLLETEEMVDIATQTYLRGDNREKGTTSTTNTEQIMDPFGQLAKDLSACSKSRDESGKIGWVDNAFHPSHLSSASQTNTEVNEAVSELISPSVIQELFKLKPKGGDILKLRHENQWHLVRVDDLLIDYVKSDNKNDTRDNENSVMKYKQRGENKVFTSRSKLKGLGARPKAPKIVNVKGKEIEEVYNEKSDVAKSYYIATSGCQMNVADSERLAGVFENKLNLQPTTNPNDANVIILNTCSIRDHAEQKVYDTLGPFAARKRKGESLGLIVAGCVAQQEGEALLKRVPEVHLVMGPQYVNRLDDLLDDVSRGIKL